MHYITFVYAQFLQIRTLRAGFLFQAFLAQSSWVRDMLIARLISRIDKYLSSGYRRLSLTLGVFQTLIGPATEHLSLIIDSE